MMYFMYDVSMIFSDLALKVLLMNTVWINYLLSTPRGEGGVQPILDLSLIKGEKA